MKLLTAFNYKKSHLLILLLFSLLLFHKQALIAQDQVQIIPQPSSISYGNGSYELGDKVNIQASEDLENEVQFLSALLEKGFTKTPKLSKKKKGIVR